MLNTFKKIQEEWGGSSDVIDHWLDKRQVLIVQYCKLAALRPGNNKKPLDKLPTPEELENFNQYLVDYISEGHFKVYNMVMNKWEATGFSPTDEISELYARIVLTTEPLLSFTDRYTDIDKDDPLEHFDEDLSDMGETLESRFALEDNLIQLIAESLAIPPGA